MTKKDEDGWSCFCGFHHKFKSRVINHAQKHVEEIQCEVRLHGEDWRIGEDQDLHDVTLVSQEGQKFPAEKLILGVTSSFLRAEMQRNSEVENPAVSPIKEDEEPEQ